MNFLALLKAFDAAVALGSAVKRFKDPSPPTEMQLAPLRAEAAGQLESRLTGVVVAALKEAFDRDHARLELERAHLDEQRRRAEEALQQEQRRQEAERELTRLRLLAGAAFLAWIASVLATVLSGGSTVASRSLLGAGWVALLGSLGASFTAQRHVAMVATGPETGSTAGARWATMSLWLLVSGLALATAGAVR